MYVRFISPWPVRRGVHRGLFGPAYVLWWDERTAEGVRLAIRHELDWFERELPAPAWRTFRVKSKKRWVPHGICWFQGEARAMVGHAFALAALIGECGVPIAKRVTHRPGQILYRDAWQIVAKPDAATPTLWC
ncbi:MAG TPA: hypothetical protein VFL92_02625 [Sphingomonas sp.]|nr:hypothetical protein [Sphingomonas sp.]